MELTEKLQKKLNDGREYRSMAVEPGTDDYMVEGYATTFEQPYHLYNDAKGREVKEQVSKDAFLNADMSDVIMQYDHEGRVFARISNDTLKLDVDDHGLKMTAYLGGTEIGRNLYEEIKGGYTNKMSFGFTVANAEVENDLTEISARSHIDGAIDEIDEEIRQREEQERLVAEKRESLAERLKALKGETNGN